MINFDSPEFKKFQDIIRKNAEAWKRHINIIAPYIKNAHKTLQKHGEQMISFRKTFEKITQDIQNNWQLSLMGNKNIAEHAIKTYQMMDSLAKDWQRFNEILFSLGWLPAGEWTSTHGRYILKLIKEKKLKQLDKEITQYYTKKRILNIYNNWVDNKSLKKSRLKILKDAIDAHICRKYTLSIIVLLTQIEGEIRNYIEEYGSIGHVELLKKFKLKLAKDKKDGFYSKTASIAVVDTILRKLFHSHGVKKKTKKVTFTRHSVIHGMNIRDFNRINSTKLILVMNYIISRDVLV